MITLQVKGSYESTTRRLKALGKLDLMGLLGRYGRLGVNALASNTPAESGLTSESWEYTVEKTAAGYSIIWSNTNTVNGVPVVILLQYGHGTGTGGYVAGRDFINPAIMPIFDKIAADVWKAVKSA